MLLVTLIKYFLHWSNKKCNIFSAAGSIENFAFCPSRYIDIILYADEGSVLDPPPALPVSTLYVLSEMHSRAGKKVASGKPCLRLCLTWYLENYMLCKCEKMVFHIHNITFTSFILGKPLQEFICQCYLLFFHCISCSYSNKQNFMDEKLVFNCFILTHWLSYTQSNDVIAMKFYIITLTWAIHSA